MAMVNTVVGEKRAAAGNEVHLFSDDESLPLSRCLQIYRLMVRSRVLEERLLKMSKSGEAYFWIGGPGEEAFQTCLGLQVKKGRGPAHDYLLLHYRNCPTLVALGVDLVDVFRQMVMTVTDPFSRGRNFVSHFARPEWNVLPICSVIEVRHTIAPGTALVQKRFGGEGITIVTGGDAGTAEGDFTSCLIWTTRPGQELPVLIVIQNNEWGISTPTRSVFANGPIIDRGRAFGIPGEVVDGTNPMASWHAVARAMAYCRQQRRPYLLEARVGRLYGHSSTSGGTRADQEPDGLALFEHQLREADALDAETAQRIRAEAQTEVELALEQALGEPPPTAEDVELHTFAPSPVDAVYPRDYTGLPGSVGREA
jgi:2-oxoisovalerate dehydrogenase E1 component alpha subunit